MSLVATLSNRSVAEIGISYAGTNEFANEMKAVLQPYVEKTNFSSRNRLNYPNSHRRKTPGRS